MALFSWLSKKEENSLASIAKINSSIWKKKYPCDAVPVDDLSHYVSNASSGLDVIHQALIRGTCPLSQEQIPWAQLEHLNILGNTHFSCNTQLEAAKIKSGAYINDRGDWLLIVHPDMQKVPSYIERCPGQLKTLSIYNVSTPKLELSQFSKLKSLKIIRNSTLSNLLGLDKLNHLNDLDISWCDNLAEVPGLEKASNLTYLTLFRCDKLRLLAGLEKLTKLTRICLYECPSITELYGLDNLTALIELDLSWCTGLVSLPALDKLRNLEELKLFCCYGITKLPDGIRHLKQLRMIQLCHLQLKELPDWFPEIAEAFYNDGDYHGHGTKRAVVELDGTTVEGIDMSIFDQPYEMVVKWFENRAAARVIESTAEEAPSEIRPVETSALNEIKVVFLGDGEAGKSHTIARLLADGNYPKNFDGQATPGIAITDQIYDLGDRQVQVHFWDFGGQEILHSMHRMFLTKRTLYVVVLNARDDKQDEQARYWLHNIKSFAPNAPVLLVVNKLDQNPNASINEIGLRQMYPSLTEVVRISALKATPDEFNTAFTGALLRQIAAFKVLESPFTPAWQRLKDMLHNMQQHYIKSDEYAEFCHACGVEESETIRSALLEWFKDLGVSFCYSESRKLEDYVVLQTQWITNAIYILLYNKILGNHNGMIHHSDIFRMLKEPDALSDTVHRVLKDVYYTSDEVQYVLNVVRQFRLSYPVDGDTEFFPMLCDRNEMDIVAKYAGQPDVLEFRMVYEYLPNNVLHRLMVDMHRDLRTDSVWLTGAHFVQSYSGLSAVVKSDGNVMTIYVRRGTEYPAKVYLDAIKEHLERITEEMGLEIKERQVVYNADGISEVFNYKMILGTLAKGRGEIYSMVRDDMISISDILCQTDHEVDNDREKLIQDILKTCRNMQKNRLYWSVSENDRNTYIREALDNMGYTAKDQTLAGISAGGKLAGELDLEIQNKSGDTITILEGLNLSGTSESRIAYWDKHLKKLLDNYNPIGLPFLVMLSYVPCSKDKYLAISSNFSDHSKTYSPDGYSVRGATAEKTAPRHMEETNYLQMMRCIYDCGGAMTTVYHIFIRLGDE